MTAEVHHHAGDHLACTDDHRAADQWAIRLSVADPATRAVHRWLSASEPIAVAAHYAATHYRNGDELRAMADLVDMVLGIRARKGLAGDLINTALGRVDWALIVAAFESREG